MYISEEKAWFYSSPKPWLAVEKKNVGSWAVLTGL